MTENKSRLEQILGEGEVKPVAKINGQNVYSFADAQNLNKRALAEEKLFGKMPELGQREMTDDGMGYKRTRVGAIAFNPDVLYMNRYRIVTKNEQKVYQVVLDYRSIKGQKSGSVTVEVPAYEVSKEGKKMIVKQIRVSAEDFINEFKGELRNEDIKKILDVIESQAQNVSDSKDAMSF
jgi:hypothetical protein